MATPRTKPELVKFLSAAGYDKKELETLNVAALKDLYKKEQSVSAGASITDGDSNASASQRGAKDACDIYNMKTGEFIRTYSAGVHGKEYRGLAKEFCRKKTDYFIKE